MRRRQGQAESSQQRQVTIASPLYIATSSPSSNDHEGSLFRNRSKEGYSQTSGIVQRNVEDMSAVIISRIKEFYEILVFLRTYPLVPRLPRHTAQCLQVYCDSSGDKVNASRGYNCTKAQVPDGPCKQGPAG
jgi:hypothetical protein